MLAGFFMNNELIDIVKSFYSSVVNEVIEKDCDLASGSTSQISSLGQSALQQLQEYCSKSEAGLMD